MNIKLIHRKEMIFNVNSKDFLARRMRMLNGTEVLDVAYFIDILKANVNTYTIECNRYESMVFCEQGASYSQQSQRYVKNTFISNDFEKELLDLYNEMTELKNPKMTGRPKVEDFKYGIPYEDARYILPLTMRTQLLATMNLYQFFMAMAKLKQTGADMRMICDGLVEHYQLFLDNVYSESLYNGFNTIALYNSEILSGLGATICTSDKNIDELVDNLDSVTSKKITKNVVGYGHESILEHNFESYPLKLSLSAYHQIIRHRLVKFKKTTDLNSLLKYNSVSDNEIYVPQSIKNNIYLYNKFLYIRETYYSYLDATNKFDIENLLNCEIIELNMIGNDRAILHVLNERLCFNAQYEIRTSLSKIADYIISSKRTMGRFIGPSCTKGKCREGKLSCGKADLMSRLYGPVVKVAKYDKA